MGQGELLECSDRNDVASIDRALLGLRRVWDAPAGVSHEGRIVEGSTLLVCLAVAETAVAGEVSITDVTRVLGVAHSTASRLVARAVDAEMVHRTGASADPRRASLVLTAAGERLVAASQAFRAARLRNLLAPWSGEEIADLARLLTRLSAAMAAAATPDQP